MNLIVFDIDGTLTDTVSAHHSAFTEGLLAAGAKNLNSKFKTFKHYTDGFIAKVLYEENTGLPFTPEKFKKFEIELTANLCGVNHQEIKGAKVLITSLISNPDFVFVMATGSLRRAAECKLRAIEIDFEPWQLVAADELIERENIVGQAIKNASEHYGVAQFERIISLGDGLWDLVTARNLELEFIGVGLDNKTVLLENGAETVVDDLTQVQF